MDQAWIPVAMGAGAYWIVYTVLLWIMMRLQKLNYRVGHLFVASALATLTRFIPIVGPYLAYAVLLIALHKFTHEDIYPDLVFTVVVTGALMFAVQMFLLTAILPTPSLDKGIDLAALELLDDQGNPLPARPTESVGGVTLRGVAYSETNRTALIGHDEKNYPLKPGEAIDCRTAQGLVQLYCEEVRSNSVIVRVSHGQVRERVDLRLP